jgi:hypothetical protein
MTILRKLPLGLITYNAFYVAPDNGSPSPLDNFYGSYYISFYPTYDIPPLGII